MQNSSVLNRVENLSSVNFLLIHGTGDGEACMRLCSAAEQLCNLVKFIATSLMNSKRIFQANHTAKAEKSAGTFA